MATGRFLAPLNGATLQQQIQKPYVDDIWDPLFNRDVQNYYRNTYGALGAVPMAYMDMWDNALTGQKGILGPGMGILGTFGRSMDKADDAILGTLTEGVNAVGNILGGSNTAPQNPIRNIFVNDYNYEGTGLMAAMGNAMARLAGAPNTKLDSSDFSTLGDRSAGTILDLATDPGYSGGTLSRLNPNTPVGQVGQILSNYDDIMADVAGNVTLPAGKFALAKSLDRIHDYVGASIARDLEDIQLGTKEYPRTATNYGQTSQNKTFTKNTYAKSKKSQYYLLRDMAIDEARQVFPQGITPWDPETADVYAKLRSLDDDILKYDSIIADETVTPNISNSKLKVSKEGREKVLNLTKDPTTSGDNELKEIQEKLDNRKTFVSENQLELKEKFPIKEVHYSRKLGKESIPESEIEKIYRYSPKDIENEVSKLTKALENKEINEDEYYNALDKLADKYLVSENYSENAFNIENDATDYANRSLEYTGATTTDYNTPESFDSHSKNPAEQLKNLAYENRNVYDSNTTLKYDSAGYHPTIIKDNEMPFSTSVSTADLYKGTEKPFTDYVSKRWKINFGTDSNIGTSKNPAKDLQTKLESEAFKYNVDYDKAFKHMQDITTKNLDKQFSKQSIWYLKDGEAVPENLSEDVSYQEFPGELTYKVNKDAKGNVISTEIVPTIPKRALVKKAINTETVPTLTDPNDPTKITYFTVEDLKHGVLKTDENGKQYFEVTKEVNLDNKTKLTPEEELEAIKYRANSYNSKRWTKPSTIELEDNYKHAEAAYKAKRFGLKKFKVYGVLENEQFTPNILNDIKSITNAKNLSFSEYVKNLKHLVSIVDNNKDKILLLGDTGDNLINFTNDVKKLFNMYNVNLGSNNPEILSAENLHEVLNTDVYDKFSDYQGISNFLDAYDFSSIKKGTDKWTTDSAIKLQKQVPHVELVLRNGQTITASKNFQIKYNPSIYRTYPGLEVKYKTKRGFLKDADVSKLPSFATDKYTIVVPKGYEIPTELWNTYIKGKIQYYGRKAYYDDTLKSLQKDLSKFTKDEQTTPEYLAIQTKINNLKSRFGSVNAKDSKVAINTDIKNILSDTDFQYKNISDSISTENSNTRLLDNLTYINSKEFTEMINRPQFYTNSELDSYMTNLFKPHMDSWNIDSNVDFDYLESHIKTYGSREQKTLFGLFNNMRVSYLKSKHGDYSSAVLAYDPIVKTRNLAKQYVESNSFKDNEISDYLTYKSISSDHIIKGDDMLRYIAGSGGKVMVTTALDVDNLRKTIKSNINKINAASNSGNILKIIDYQDGKQHVLGYAFDTSNVHIKKGINNITGLFGKNLGLQDMIFYKSKPEVISEYKKLHYTNNWDKLDELFNGIRANSEKLANTFGLEADLDPNYIKWTMGDTPESTKFFQRKTELANLNDKDLTDICSAIKDLNSKGSFGISRQNRSYLGSFEYYKEGYTRDLLKIHDSTFIDGYLDNSLAQSHLALFTNKNFSLKNNFKDANQVKEALYASDGNFTNCSLVTPILDDNGKITGYHRYNKFDDADIKAAFEDEDCVLIENNMIALMDRTLKKDARMSNKFYKFLNKYFTVPFKMGTLANPGFLVGNIQDAYFKQATALAEKYGTSLEDELTEVALSMRYTVQLNNSFTNIFDKYRQYLDSITDPVQRQKYYETLKAHKGTGIDYRVVMNNPKYFENWMDFLNHGGVLNDKELATAKLFTYLNNYQNTAMYNNNNLDMNDVFAELTTNKYDVPNNIVERVLYGDPSQPKVKRFGKPSRKFSAMGLVVNNTFGDTILRSSNYIEDLMRTSSILNDLRHQGYDIDKLKHIINIPEEANSKLRQDLRISMSNAVNTMHAANFDYDNISPLMNEVSNILPFPTFYLKNLAFWAQQAVNKPQLIDNIISIQENMWSGRDTTEDEFAAEAKGRGAIPIGGPSKHLTGIVKQSPYNSMFGAFNAVNNFKEDFAYRTNPLMRPVARHLQDPKDIKYRPYSTNPYEKNITKGDPKFSELAYMFHQLNPYERTINTFARTPKKVSTNNWQLSDFAPSIFQPDFSKKSDKK